MKKTGASYPWEAQKALRLRVRKAFPTMLEVLSSRPFFAAFVVVFLALHALHLLIGLADSGDSFRSTSFLFDRPVGFDQNLYDINSEEGRRRFLTHWLDQWILLPDAPRFDLLETFSSYKIYLGLQVLFSCALMGEGAPYSIMVGSLLSRVIYIGGWLLLFGVLRAVFPVGLSWIPVIVLAVVSLNADFTSYFNSLYEEQLLIICMPLLAWLLYLFRRKGQVVIGVSVLILSAVLGASKLAFFLLPMIAAFFLFPLFSGRWAKLKFLVLVACAQGSALQPFLEARYVEANRYHAVYYGVLQVLTGEELQRLGSLGEKPVFPECVGVSSFHPGGLDCLKKAQASYGDVLYLLASEPVIGWRLFLRLIDDGRHLELEYLGKSLSGAPDFSQIALFSLWQKVYTYYVNVIVGLMFLGVLSCVWRRRRLEESIGSARLRLNPLEAVGVFLVIFGLIQYVVALGDGFFEINRHLMAGNFCLSMAFGMLLAALLSRRSLRGDA